MARDTKTPIAPLKTAKTAKAIVPQPMTVTQTGRSEVRAYPLCLPNTEDQLQGLRRPW
jgi:hypothetical protein